MYGSTPWIISPIDPHRCDLHKTHLFDQSLHMWPIHCPLLPSGLYQKKKNSKRIIRNALRDSVDHVWVSPVFTFWCAKQGNEDLIMTPQQTGAPSSLPVIPSRLKQKALMNILETELIAVNYKLCSHCGPTKEDISAPQSDVITKVRHTPPCVIHPWQPPLTGDLPLVKKEKTLPLSWPRTRDTPTRPPPRKLFPVLTNSMRARPLRCGPFGLWSALGLA